WNVRARGVWAMTLDSAIVLARADEILEERSQEGQGRSNGVNGAVARPLPSDECPVGPRMMSTRADQITPTRPVWLWDRWLSVGALHVLVGRQGGGKSTFAAWVSAQVTRGTGYPDDQITRFAGNVATLSLEEPA